MSKTSALSDILYGDAVSRLRDASPSPSLLRHESAVQALARKAIVRLDRLHRVTDAIPQYPRRDEVDDLCAALLIADPEAALDLLLHAHAEGVPAEDMSLRYLAGAARQLGTWWEEDRVSATEVVLATGLIFGVMRSLHRLLSDDAQLIRPELYRAFFASVPGETHTLGVTMAADHFRKLGWNIILRTQTEHEPLLREASQSGCRIIGLSSSRSSMVFPLSRMILALRAADAGCWILVCGQIVSLEPDLQHLIDADAVTSDLNDAGRLMESQITRAQKVRAT